MKVSNRWRHHIKIKDMFTEETTPELIVKLCDALIPQIDRIIKTEDNGMLIDSGHYIEQLEESKDHFEFLRSLADGSIPESEFADYSFDGDYEDWFNGYLNDLYNIGDARVVTKLSNVQEKFIWIG